jgi:hypothetical protein
LRLKRQLGVDSYWIKRRPPGPAQIHEGTVLKEIAWISWLSSGANARFAALFGEPVHDADKPLTNFHMDVAASIQAVLDETVLRLSRSSRSSARRRTHSALTCASRSALRGIHLLAHGDPFNKKSFKRR